MNFEKWVINIQTAGYNDARTVYIKKSMSSPIKYNLFVSTSWHIIRKIKVAFEMAIINLTPPN